MATVHFYAAARDAAGCRDAVVPASSTTQLRGQLADAYGPTLAKVLTIASLLVDGRHVPADVDEPLRPDSEVDVLPPFAGG
jgi:molybdopterin synthase sulfur carrier subunit